MNTDSKHLSPATTRPSEVRSSNPHPQAANFDSLARIYRYLEYLTFGPMLSRCRLHFLSRLASARYVLVLGDGDGRFIAEFLRSNRDAVVQVVDSSPAMLRALRRRIAPIAGAEARVNLTCCDALGLFFQDPTARDRETHRTEDGLRPAKFDLVISHFFLDCFSTDDVCQLIDRVEPHLAADGLWLLSEFAIPRGGPALRRLLPVAGRLFVAGLYRLFGVLTGLRARTLPDFAGAFVARGFEIVERDDRLGGLLISEVWRREPLLGH